MQIFISVKLRPPLHGLARVSGWRIMKQWSTFNIRRKRFINMDAILKILASAEVKYIVILISLDVVLGIIAALKTKEFVLGKVAGFMKKGVLVYVFGFAVLAAVGQVTSMLSMVATVAYFLILLALVGSILNNLGKLGLPIPKMLRK